ncbi:MAG: hypothetical protein IT186_22160 [Acidobacteria bacterium]|nr:hypothetical protein [Acidobacteriota bacterium]MCG3193490.1 hypothetical protein [Thermoanaerobaculia bacterium]
MPTGTPRTVSVTILATTLLFTAGTLAFQYASSIVEPRVNVSGVVRYHKADLTVSADSPEGYYVESSAIGRIYLRHNEMPGVLNRHIEARGTLRGVCGNDKATCFPLMNIERLRAR